ncbi:MAG: hypothetical protein LBF16_01730 [Pseudomonadales bacterium]|jgi:hypothetical protein|nr:hypothetical protein [Pseudomonadales bacterium]
MHMRLFHKNLGALAVASALAFAVCGAQGQGAAVPQADDLSGYIEAQCGGGIAGRLRLVRVDTSGVVSSSNSWRTDPVAIGDIDPARVTALWQRLDAAGFDTLTSPPRGRPIPDGISCAIVRSVKDGPLHAITFPDIYQTTDPGLIETRKVMSDVQGIGRSVAQETP